MQTSKQWWANVKNSKELLEDWLVKQYRGEVTAADRIVRLGNQFSASDRQKKILKVIADQETQHALWVKDLLNSRGIDPVVENAEERYWAQTLSAIDSFETGAAIAAHAEKMRLERIKVIADDETAPPDIREVFAKILRDELFHERAFREMSDEESMNKTAGSHELGLRALGLSI